MKSELKSRLLIGSCGIILTTIATFVSFESSLFFLVTVWTFIFLELVSMLSLPGITRDAFFFFSLLLFIFCYQVLQTHIILVTLIIGLIWLISVVILFNAPIKRQKAFAFLYMIYITIPFVYLINLRKTNGESMFFLLFLIVWALDIFSYCFGICIGKHLIAPKISPKKTWEGTIFGILFSFSLGVLGFYYLQKTLSLPIIIAIFFIPLFGFLGDLFESSIKRSVNKKDSGTFLMGHGGYLDRFDSMLFVSVFFGILLQLI